MKAPSALSHSAMSRVDGMQSWSAPSVPTLPGRGPALRLYDSADRQVRPVTPGRTATMYVCGITPYDATHLGHAATYLTFDLVNRVWLDAGHDVHYVQNIRRYYDILQWVTQPQSESRQQPAEQYHAPGILEQLPDGV